jgi:hypothetical protein
MNEEMPKIKPLFSGYSLINRNIIGQEIYKGINANKVNHLIFLNLKTALFLESGSLLKL